MSRYEYREDPEEKNRNRMRNSQRAKVAMDKEDIEGYLRYRKDARLGEAGQKTTRETGAIAYANRAKRISEQTRSIAQEAKCYADMAIGIAGSLHSSITDKNKSSSSSSSSSYISVPKSIDSEVRNRLEQELKHVSKDFRNDSDDGNESDFSDVEVSQPQHIFDSNGIPGSMSIKPISSISRNNEDSFQKTYNDTIVPESSLQQLALDMEEYKGVDPHNLTQKDRDYIENQRAIEYKDDIQRIYDRVDEAEILSGGDRDSLFSATDLNLDGQGDSLYPDEKHFMSAYERGQNMHAIKEVDLDNFDFSDYKSNEGLDEDKSSLFRGSEGIMSSIKALTELSADDGGSWFSEDKSMAEYITPEQRMASINKARFDNDIREKLGKYNARGAGSNNKMLLATGASLSTLNEMRKGDEGTSDYKQPSRSYKGNAVKLVRNSRRKGILMEQQYDP